MDFGLSEVKIIPQEMATRYMYENNPEEFLVWYYKDLLSTETYYQTTFING